ncbi:MAG: TraM recognition domain-containing protein [Propionibacteriaceae bacterium]|nr:TraM recognition domain-containing protein [Propionibacteriaceae bacterium]
MGKNRSSEPGGLSPEMVLVCAALGVLLATAGMLSAARALGWRIAGVEDAWPGLGVGFRRILGGELPWPSESWWVLGGELAGLAAIAVLVAVWLVKRRRKSTRVDRAGRWLGSGDDITPLMRSSAAATARRLGADVTTPGLPLGRTVSGGVALFSSFEDMVTGIAGPRTGKSTSLVIPAIAEAPGGVLTTSNKRDVLDATRWLREEAGPVWVFDPQSVAFEEPSMWWNPLTYVTDDIKAADLASHFAAGSRNEGDRGDAFFTPEGERLLAGLLLAAALGGRPITDVYRWLSRDTDQTPVELLEAGGYTLLGDMVAATIMSPDKQRQGVYGTARGMASCLTNRKAAAWVAPLGEQDHRPQFDPLTLLDQQGTLYSLSREGQGSAGPLVTALTVACITAAEERAALSPGGRLQVPLVGVLDEAANVCRWRNLPDLYSHYGSRGIVLETLLQSWSQGVAVWGEAGMKKLWSSSNVKVYLGGVAERGFLDDLSALIGDYDKTTYSVSTGDGRRSRSMQLRRERTLDAADLGALPRGRAIILASGCRPTLVRTQPWMDQRYAPAIHAALRHDRPRFDKAMAALRPKQSRAETPAVPPMLTGPPGGRTGQAAPALSAGPPSGGTPAAGVWSTAAGADQNTLEGGASDGGR